MIMVMNNHLHMSGYYIDTQRIHLKLKSGTGIWLLIAFIRHSTIPHVEFFPSFSLFFFFWINMLIFLSAKAVIWDRNISSLEQKYVNNTREEKKNNNNQL